MFAGTIAEYFVEEGEVRLELEVGSADLAAFADFLDTGLTITADGQRLQPRLEGVERGVRERRDEITGEPLPALEDGEPPEPVVRVRLVYPFEGRPERLTFGGPDVPRVSVGFVVYHGTIAVNDFRYLTASQTLLLDWDDPFYSHFERRALRRQYDAPMSGFLYVDPFEVRKEIVLRPLDLQQVADLGLEGLSEIPPEIQPEIERRVAAFLREHHPVSIDGVPVQGELARINFLDRSLRTSRVIDPRRTLDVHAAVLGAIFVYPTEGLPQRVTLDWDLWTPRVTRIPAATVDEAGPLPAFLVPDAPELVWQNFLTNPSIPKLQVLEAPPGALRRAAAGWGGWLLAIVAAAGVGFAWRTRRLPARLLAGLVVLLSIVTWGWGRGAAISEARAGEIVGGLLHNVYRAFDFRDEGRIYDLLARSATGDLLERVYLDTRRGLELQSQGGARARVKRVEVVEVDAVPASGGGFRARTTWHVAGSVGHWGHVHERRNRYRADLHVAPMDGRWKILDLEILEEERL